MLGEQQRRAYGPVDRRAQAARAGLGQRPARQRPGQVHHTAYRATLLGPLGQQTVHGARICQIVDAYLDRAIVGCRAGRWGIVGGPDDQHRPGALPGKPRRGPLHWRVRAAQDEVCGVRLQLHLVSRRQIRGAQLGPVPAIAPHGEVPRTAEPRDLTQEHVQGGCVGRRVQVHLHAGDVGVFPDQRRRQGGEHRLAGPRRCRLPAGGGGAG